MPAYPHEVSIRLTFHGIYRKVSAALTLLFLISVTSPAQASWLTKSLTAAEKNNAIDINLSASWDQSKKTAKITREWIRDGQNVDVRELLYEEHIQRLLLDLRIGLFHDVELRLRAPLVFREDRSLRFADEVSGGVDGIEGNSTLCCKLDASTGEGSQLADDSGRATRLDPRFPILSAPAERYRAGLGDMTFGLGWSPFVDHKDEAYPTLTLRADVTAPTAKQRDPAELSALSKNEGGNVGMGLTVFDLSLGVSKRMRESTPSFDPYFLIGAEIPVATEGQKKLGMEPQIKGRFLIGTEILIYESKDVFMQRFGLDFSFQTKYVSTGRSYSELSSFLPNFNRTSPAARARATGEDPTIPVQDKEYIYEDFSNPAHYGNQVAGQSCGAVMGIACGELNQIDQYLELEGSAAVHIQFTEYSLLRAGFRLQHDTGHFLTNEHTGTDLDPSNAGSVCDNEDKTCAGVLNVVNSNGEDERSKYWDPRYDVPGRRIRIEQVLDWTFFITGAATF